MHLPHREHCSISFPDLDFKVGHYMEAWEMDEEDDESYGVAAGSRAVSGSGSTSVRFSRPRVSVIGRPSRATGLERRGNTTKVGFIVSLGEEAVGRLAVSLRVVHLRRRWSPSDSTVPPYVVRPASCFHLSSRRGSRRCGCSGGPTQDEESQCS